MTSEQNGQGDSVLDVSSISMQSAPGVETSPANAKGNEKNATFLSLYGPSMGPCIAVFSTSVNRASGRLYAATEALIFHSNIFGFERRLCLKVSDIESIESYRSTSIKVSMVDCEDHVFRKFKNRDAVLQILNDLYDKRRTSTQIPPTPRSSVVRENIPISMEELKQIEEQENTHDASLFSQDFDPQELRDRLLSTDSAEPLSELRPRSRSVPYLHQTNTLLPEDPNQKKTSEYPTLRTRRFRRSKSQITSSGEVARVADEVQALEGPIDFDRLDGQSSADHVVNPTDSSDTLEIWQSRKSPYEEIALSVRASKELL